MFACDTRNYISVFWGGLVLPTAMLGDGFHRFWMGAWSGPRELPPMHVDLYSDGNGVVENANRVARMGAWSGPRELPPKLKICKTSPNWHFGSFYCPHGTWPTEPSNPPDFDPNPCNLNFYRHFEYPGALPADPQNGILAWRGAKQDPPQPPKKHGNIVSCSRSKRVPTEKYRKSKKYIF